MAGLHYGRVVECDDLYGTMIQKMMNPVEKKYNEAEVACNYYTAEAKKAAIPYFACIYCSRFLLFFLSST